MRAWVKRATALGVCAAAIAISSTSAIGGISNVDEARTISIYGEDENPGATYKGVNESVQASPEFSDFARSLADSSGGGVTVSADQNSRIAFTTSSLDLHATGEAAAAGGHHQSALAASTYWVTFAVDSLTQFTLNERIDPEKNGGNVEQENYADFGAALLNGRQNPPDTNSFAPRTFPSNSLVPPLPLSSGTQTWHQFTGILSPGTYTLEGGGFSLNTIPDYPINALYQLEFSVGPQAVPLPGAFWPGLMLLLGLTVAGYFSGTTRLQRFFGTHGY